MEDRPLAPFVAVSGNSIVANARFAPACRNNPVVAGGLRDLRPGAFVAPLDPTAGDAAQEIVWL